ncbi:MAG: sulfotransferase domain-containing protein [Xanthomonadaceae bacterium]|jgi:hypothetical protein|nr:sulfotransferase domain-containing protein [Xanthomonadaceae bacterium]
MQAPERCAPDAPAYDVDILSPELPCGAAWLASALLDLRVPLWRPWGIDDRGHWRHEGGSRWRYSLPGSPWRRLLPGLVDGRVFRLRHRPVPRFSHGWPGEWVAAPRRVLFVRDPRDALYSGWRRACVLRQTTLVFVDWLHERFHHWPIDRATWLALYWRAWLAAPATAALVLRFEDSKRDPQGTLALALRHLGLVAPARARAAACAAARHEVAAAADRELAAAGVGPRLLAGGEPFEWRRHFTPEMHAAVDRGLAPVCAAFGYPAPTGAPLPAFDADDVARAMVGPHGDPTHVRAALEAARAVDPARA